MALLDPRSDAVVIRVVYDGAPMAGKTTSVRALGRGLGAQVTTPAEVNGRTLYFDWLDYTGGLFEGRRIRCQIISVPGQATLAPRRRRLLESADVVVFVGDSSPAGFEADRGYLRGLAGVLAELSGPPVGIVFQANKRDRPDAIPIELLRSMLSEANIKAAVVESVATETTGIREAFVFAVRLALDRVRELLRTEMLPTKAASVDSAGDLLDQLQEAEAGAMELAAASELKHTSLADVRRADGDKYVPAPPDERVASGLIWPPVDGRLILHELAAARISVRRSATGDWTGVANDRWQIHSPAEAVFPHLESGRALLVQTARSHAALPRDALQERCVVLAADGCGAFRLWHIERIRASLQ